MIDYVPGHHIARCLARPAEAVTASATVWSCAQMSRPCSSRLGHGRIARLHSLGRPVKLPSSGYLTNLFDRSVALRAGTRFLWYDVGFRARVGLSNGHLPITAELSVETGGDQPPRSGLRTSTAHAFALRDETTL